MWSKSNEEYIQHRLLEIDPDYRSVIKRGFYYIQMPSRPSRFYMREALAWLQDHNKYDGPLLDYGCGVGTFMAYLTAHGFNNITGADVDQQCIDTARQIFDPMGPVYKKIKLQHVGFEDIYEMPLGYKVIFIMDLLYGKAFKIDGVLKSAYDALPPGGVFMFDLFDYEEPTNPGRQYIKETDMHWKARDMFEVLQTTTYRQNNSKTFYVLRRLPD